MTELRECYNFVNQNLSKLTTVQISGQKQCLIELNKALFGSRGQISQLIHILPNLSKRENFNPKYCNIFPISNLHIHDILQLFGWQAIAQRVEKIYFLWHKLSASAYISLEMFHKFMLDYFNYFYSNFVYSIWCLAQLWMTANINSFLWEEFHIKYF